MAPPRITRRSLLAAGAGALAAEIARPAGALAALAPQPQPPALLSERRLGTLAAGSPATLHLARAADLVGVQWRAPAGAHIELRVEAPGGGWSRWVKAGSHGHLPEGAGAGEQAGEPIWTGGTRALQLRSARALSGLRVHLIDVSAGEGARALARRRSALAASLALAGPPLASAVAQPPIVARHAWAGRGSRPRVAPEYGAVRLAFVHHTDNPNGYSAGEVPAMLRAIYVFHRYVNGWNDIGYNFVVDLYGRIFEARAGGVQEPVTGAHAGGYNYASTGVAVLGTFSGEPVSPAARAALRSLLAWKLSLHGVAPLGRVGVRVNRAGAGYSRFPAGAHVSLPHIAGHRDADSTDCPGDALYAQLAGVRGEVHALAPAPATATLVLTPATAAAPPPAPPPGTTPPAPTPGTEPAPAATPATLGGRLTRAGVPIAGAPVLLQARTVAARGETVDEQTLVQAVTDANGAWSLPAPAATTAAGIDVRALYPGAGGAGASVSEPLHIAPAGAAPPA